jgi:hypothetical protein
VPHFTRYTCKPELLPTVEAVLAAHGHTIAIPPYHYPNGATAIVMTSGATSVLLSHTPAHDVAEIEVWGTAQTIAVQVLDSSPIELAKQSTDSTAPTQRGNMGG